MSSTNKTDNYDLPIFVSTDVPSWLEDVNGAMTKIDASIKLASSTGGVSSTEFNALKQEVTDLEAEITTLKTKLADVVKIDATTGGLTAEQYSKLAKVTI